MIQLMASMGLNRRFTSTGVLLITGSERILRFFCVCMFREMQIKSGTTEEGVLVMRALRRLL
jgi:hypothetical protein